MAGSVSISALFFAGYMPGILWGIGNMIVAGVMAARLGYISKREKIPFIKALLMVLDAIPSLFLIFIIIGGILGGAFTATEASAIAVVYALLLSTIYKVIASWQDSKKEGAAPFNLSRAIIGAITPPVGTVMFTGVRVANTTIETVIRKLLPFFAVTILILMLVTYIEPITMWLPRLFELVA